MDGMGEESMIKALSLSMTKRNRESLRKSDLQSTTVTRTDYDSRGTPTHLDTSAYLSQRPWLTWRRV